MPGKILIANATRTGSTADVADAIARRLCEAGLAADVLPVGGIVSLDGYDGAVLGSAVRYAGWLPEMIGSLEVNHLPLSALPVGFFTMHMLAGGNEPAAVAERAKYTEKARSIVKPIDGAFFEGMIDLSRLSFLDPLVVRLAKSPVGDSRDWQRITGWADALAPRFAA